MKTQASDNLRAFFQTAILFGIVASLLIPATGYTFCGTRACTLGDVPSDRGGRGGSETPTYEQTYDPVAAQRTEGNNLNREGIRFYNEKNWAKAVEYFEKALQKWPDNKIIQDNLEGAKEALRRETAEKERQQIEAQTAEKMRGSINQFSSTLNTQQPTKSSGLDFQSGKAAAPPSSGGLNFLPAQPAPSSEGRGIKKSKALEEAAANLHNTQQGNPGAVFDTKGTKGPGTSTQATVTDAGQAIEMSDKARKDPRMVEELENLNTLQAKRKSLDDQRDKLAKERNSAPDDKKMNQLDKELKKVGQAYQANILLISDQAEKINSLKLRIDAEVGKPTTGGQKTKEGTK